MRAKSLTAVVLFVVAAGCDAQRGNGNNDNNNNNNNGNNGSGVDMAYTPASNPDLYGNNCGVQTFVLTKGGPPDLLIVLDRSGSMSDPPASGTGTKWDDMTTAINSVASSLGATIKFGLSMFPSDNDCGVSSTIAVPVDVNNATPIMTAMSGTSPGGSTPTAAAVAAGATYLTGLTDGNPKYMLLATDGEPNCAGSGGACTCAIGTLSGSQCCGIPIVGCIPCALASGGDDAAGAEKAVSDAAAAGVNTFVIGISADSSDDTVLNAMATAGRTARSGTPQYYPVGSSTDLVTAVNSIAGQIISCNLNLGTAPTSPDLVDIDIAGATVPRDTTHTNGWDWGPGNLSVQFYGTYCTQLQSGTISDVQAVLNCPPVM